MNSNARVSRRAETHPRCVLSWAEIDADFGDMPVLLATAVDGRSLEAEGCQLVVSSDRCGARYVSGITSLWFGACPIPAAGVPSRETVLPASG
jgi:hypothetical protein